MSTSDQERFEEEMNRVGISTIANELGIARNTVYNWISKGNAPFNMLLTLRNKGVDLDYIFTGNRKTSAQIIEHSPASEETDYLEIPHYNVQAAAGVGVINTLEELLRPLAFRRDWLAARHLSAANLVIVDVKGESMEPKLQDGDLVLVDKSQIDIASGKTYVLRMEGNLLVKNLQMLPHGQVQVASFNTGFPPYQVDLSDESLDMAVIGRIVASMHEW